MTPHTLTEAAAILAGWPRLVTRLRQIHVAGPNGRCRGCPSQVLPVPNWPCRISALAEAAASAGQADGTGRRAAMPRCPSRSSTS